MQGWKHAPAVELALEERVRTPRNPQVRSPGIPRAGKTPAQEKAKCRRDSVSHVRRRAYSIPKPYKPYSL